jgi:hypothetical protein
VACVRVVLGFGSVFVFELSVFYVPVTLVFNVNHTAVVEFRLLVSSFKEESLVLTDGFGRSIMGLLEIAGYFLIWIWNTHS